MENLISTQDIKIICITRCYYGTVSIKAITSINKEKYASCSLQVYNHCYGLSLIVLLVGENIVCRCKVHLVAFKVLNISS